jgi:hypothetical protein
LVAVRFKIEGWQPAEPGQLGSKEPQHRSHCETTEQVEAYVKLMLETGYRVVRIEEKT